MHLDVLPTFLRTTSNSQSLLACVCLCMHLSWIHTGTYASNNLPRNERHCICLVFHMLLKMNTKFVRVCPCKSVSLSF